MQPCSPSGFAPPLSRTTATGGTHAADAVYLALAHAVVLPRAQALALAPCASDTNLTPHSLATARMAPAPPGAAAAKPQQLDSEARESHDLETPVGK